MKRTQIGWVIILISLIIIGSIFLNTKDSSARTGALAIVAIVFLLAYKLTIRVTETHVSFSMGIGIIHGKYELNDIISCHPDSYFSMGWGIRFRPDGILYNVSGNKAIELSLKSRSGKIWIGTDQPEELATYINSQIQKNNCTD